VCAPREHAFVERASLDDAFVVHERSSVRARVAMPVRRALASVTV